MATPLREAVAPAPIETGTRRRLAFAAASGSLVAAFAASASPIPLYNLYRDTAALTPADLSLTVVSYFVGTLTALLCLGRISNHVGRRPAGLATLLLLVAGSLVLLNVTGVLPLAGGRFLMGLGCGLASSALMAYVADTAPADPPWLASAVVSQSPMLGLTIGSLVSGVVVEYVPAPQVVVYLVMAAALLACCALIWASPETRSPEPGLRGSLRPHVGLTAQARPLMPVAAWIFTSTWAMGGFYQAFGPTITQERLHTDNAVVVALVFSAYMASSLAGAPIAGRYSPATAQRLAMGVFALAVPGLLVATMTGSVAAFIGFSMVAGACQGMAMAVTLRALMHGATPAERAPLLAAIYLCSYAGAMVAALTAGQRSRVLSLVELTAIYGVLAIVAAVVTATRARNPV